MYSQVDSDGHQSQLLEAIIDYSKQDDNTVHKSDKYNVTRSGRRRLRQTTAGWKLLVRWKDGNEQWVPLKLLKESNPVDVDELAQARKIQDEPAFSWWVPFTLRREKDRIISAVNSRVKKTTHKYDIEVPTSVQHAKEIDECNGNTYWADAIVPEHTPGTFFFLGPPNLKFDRSLFSHPLPTFHIRVPFLCGPGFF